MAITEFHSNVCQAAVAALWGCRLLGSSQAFSLMLPICRTTKSNNIVANRQPTNLFFMCGRTNLGAKKEREKEKKTLAPACLHPLHGHRCNATKKDNGAQRWFRIIIKSIKPDRLQGVHEEIHSLLCYVCTRNPAAAQAAPVAAAAEGTGDVERNL